MSDSSSSNIKTIPAADLPLKTLFDVGSNKVVVIDKSIVKRLGINQDNTLFQQEMVEGGIFLRIVRKSQSDLQSGN